jgi:hypothetical protein
MRPQLCHGASYTRSKLDVRGSGSVSKVLDESTRREAFSALVRLQDEGTVVTSSREQVATTFQISVPLLLLIEREGLRKQWPPLDRAYRTHATDAAPHDTDHAGLSAEAT